MNFTSGDRLTTFDTNVLIYSIDARDRRKHDIANRIVSSCMEARTVVMLQCLNEFYSASTRKGHLPPAEAAGIVQTVCGAMDMWSPTEADTVKATIAHRTHMVPFFDALLWAAASRAGCTTLLTEDLQDGRVLGGLTFRNPFVPGFDLDEVLR